MQEPKTGGWLAGQQPEWSPGGRPWCPRLVGRAKGVFAEKRAHLGGRQRGFKRVKDTRFHCPGLTRGRTAESKQQGSRSQCHELFKEQSHHLVAEGLTSKAEGRSLLSHGQGVNRSPKRPSDPGTRGRYLRILRPFPAHRNEDVGVGARRGGGRAPGDGHGPGLPVAASGALQFIVSPSDDGRLQRQEHKAHVSPTCSHLRGTQIARPQQPPRAAYVRTT